MEVSVWVNIIIFVLATTGGIVAVISSQKERHSWAYHFINGLVAVIFLVGALVIFYFTHVAKNGHI